MRKKNGKKRQRLSIFLLNRNLRVSTDQSTPEVITINNDYCLIDSKTLKRKPFHRAGFFFYKRGAFRSAKQVNRTLANQNHLHIHDLFYLGS